MYGGGEESQEPEVLPHHQPGHRRSRGGGAVCFKLFAKSNEILQKQKHEFEPAPPVCSGGGRRGRQSTWSLVPASGLLDWI